MRLPNVLLTLKQFDTKFQKLCGEWLHTCMFTGYCIETVELIIIAITAISTILC